MNTDLKSEDVLARVKDQLNKNSIKLWQDPYYSENGIGPDEEQAILLLSEQVTEKLDIGQQCCISALKELQSRAISRLKSNTIFKETGVGTIKVKIPGKDSTNLSVDITLTSTTDALIQELSQRLNIANERFKLISQGQVLKPTETLMSQGVKNGSQLMAVIMTDVEEIHASEKRFKSLETTKNDIHLLADRSDLNNDMYFQIENQSGEALNIPPHERKALVTAMTFHEKGRAALKKMDYALALVLFLEADKEYNDCTSQLLNTCDNYALLHLDIAWCYLCLRNPAQIPDADRRLSLCEQEFHKSYGPNMERLMAIKGTTGNEMALFMRLHLLQGVVHFHQNRRAEAKSLFQRARVELNDLKVDDKSVSLLMELGFSSTEALLGLRAARGNIEVAEELLNRKLKERELARIENASKLKLERERKALGLCKDGKQFCEPIQVSQLEGMGFSRHQSVEALKMANNVVSDAISIIQDTPHLLPSNSGVSISEESIAQILSLGFDQELARHALENYPSLAKAIQSLSGITDSSGASCSTADGQVTKSASAISFLENLRIQHKKKLEDERKAFKRLSKDIIDTDLAEDHLDLNLTQEEEFLLEYMSLLE